MKKLSILTGILLSIFMSPAFSAQQITVCSGNSDGSGLRCRDMGDLKDIAQLYREGWRLVSVVNDGGRYQYFLQK